MEQEIIGRKKEKDILQRCYDSGRPEFVAVYGRRRIGKTFLVKKFFHEDFAFYTTGIYGESKQAQLNFFSRQLNQYSGGVYYPMVDNWFDAFDQLKHFLSSIKKERYVVFFDELPWLDTHKSHFKMALDVFWNSWASTQNNLMLVVCGSSTTWMMNKLIGDKGGLHNRLTQRIYLAPFSLKETEDYLKSIQVEWDRMRITECYMAMGGTPYYLSKIKKGTSLAQNIDDLFFAPNAELRSEYSFLFRSLFNESKLYNEVIEVLCKKSKGMTRHEILQSLKMTTSGKLTKILDDLESCDFIRRYSAFGKKERGSLYQLTDLYTLFYHRFIANSSINDAHAWTNMIDNPSRQAWTGYAFEQVCLQHIPQIKKVLGISGILTNVCSWIGEDDSMKGQIDMVIDRRDKIVNLCEMKYTENRYTITKEYAQKLIERRELFRRITKTKKALHLTMITPNGISMNPYSEYIQSEVTLDGLFQETD